MTLRRFLLLSPARGLEPLLALNGPSQPRRPRDERSIREHRVGTRVGGVGKELVAGRTLIRRNHNAGN
jgi:hypothetical protein